MIEELENANNGEPTRMSVSVDILRRGILRELDRLSDGYKEAREAWAGPTLARVALKFGQDFAKYTPEFIEHKMGEMSASEREFARLGLANTLRKTLLMTGERGDEVRKLRLPYIKMQLRAFFDSDAAFNRYFESINAEHMMWESWAKVYGGSNSADKLAADQRLHASAASQAFLAGKSLFTGHGIDAMSHAARAAGHFVPHKNAHQNLAEAKLLATPVQSAVNTLQGATNQMPTIRIHPKTIAATSAVASPSSDGRR
jgi:hypothetical protein